MNQPTHKESNEARDRRKLMSKMEERIRREKDTMSVKNKEWRTTKSFWKFKNIIVGK